MPDRDVADELVEEALRDDGDGQPVWPAGGLDQDAVGVAALGELHLVEQDEDVAVGELVGKAEPGQEVRLVGGTDHVR